MGTRTRLCAAGGSWLLTGAGPRWWPAEMAQEERGRARYVPMGSPQGLLTGCCHQPGGLLWEGTEC